MAATRGRKHRAARLEADAVRPAPIVLVTGTERFFADRAIRLVRATLVTETPAATGGELMTLVSPSLFFEPRLVIAREVHRASDAFLDDALRFADAPIEGTTLVLRHESGNRGRGLLDAVRGREDAVEVACASLRASDLPGFVVAEFRRGGRRIEPGAITALVAAFGADLDQLGAACKQLLDTTDGEVTEEVVDRYYAGRVETTGFKIAQEAIAGRAASALGLVRAGFATGLNPVPIVAACALKLRTMARLLGLRGSDAELAGIVGGAPWQIGQARRDLQRWSAGELGRAILLVAETDHLVKGAGRDASFAVERLVRRLAERDFETEPGHDAEPGLAAGRGPGTGRST